jgi:hypothetical protein
LNATFLIFVLKPLTYTLVLATAMVLPGTRMQQAWWRPLFGAAVRSALGLGPGIVLGFALKSLTESDAEFYPVYTMIRFAFWLAASKAAFPRASLGPLLGVALVGTVLNFILDTLWLGKPLYEAYPHFRMC